MRSNLVAFTGYGGSGKDEAAKPLIESGYTRVAFGDIIKGQCDGLVKAHLGFSAFTEDRALKPRIRRTLESWGEDNYDNVFSEFFAKLPARAVNTRLCRVPEAREWVRRGGVVLELRRPGVEAETEWSRNQLAALHEHGLIHTVIYNTADVASLHHQIRNLLELS
jgi:hypothetical protein